MIRETVAVPRDRLQNCHGRSCGLASGLSQPQGCGAWKMSGWQKSAERMRYTSQIAVNTGSSWVGCAFNARRKLQRIVRTES